MLQKLKSKIKKSANPEKAKILQRFFKTGKGEYGEGDVFLGVVVPEQRNLVREFWKEINSKDIQKLLDSKIHEERMVGLLVLIKKYEKSGEDVREKIFNFYLRNTTNINNWDLVDLSAPNIVGNFLMNKDKGILYELAKSENLWEKRIAIVSTFAFIRKNDFEDALKISKDLINDKHDLIHKAVGWMLREVGKRNQEILKEFLRENYKKMPGTMLRYAIERFEDSLRKKYLCGEI